MFVTYLKRSPAGATVGPGQHRGTSLGGASSCQEVVEQRRTPCANEGVEGRDGEHAELVQRILRCSRYVGQEGLQTDKTGTLTKLAKRSSAPIANGIRTV